MVEMVQTSRGAKGRATYQAQYTLDTDGSWLIRVHTENGDVEIRAARLIDVERRGYEVVRSQCGLESGTYDVDFEHVIDLTGSASQPTR
jgi:hypothetical protein